MIITNVKLRLHDKPRLKAVACIEFDGEVIVNDIQIIQDGDHLRVELPRAKYAQIKGLETIVPQTPEARSKITNAVLEKYVQERRNQSLVRARY